jgi:hypothetical protein
LIWADRTSPVPFVDPLITCAVDAEFCISALNAGPVPVVTPSIAVPDPFVEPLIAAAPDAALLI